MPGDEALRKELIGLLTGGNAHASFADTVRDFPVDHAGDRTGGSPHSAWELIEHLRIAQEDIVRFCGGPSAGYVELKFPDDYWPKSASPNSDAEWNKSIASIAKDLERFAQMVEDRSNSLEAPFPWGTGQNLLREALVLADHNAYHLGQLMLIRRCIESNR